MRFLSVHTLTMTGDLSRFDEMTDELYEELLGMPDVIDPDMAVNMASGTIDVQMLVEADDDLDASAKSACLLRTAIHTLGGNTPGWGGWEKAVGGVQSSTRAAELAGA